MSQVIPSDETPVFVVNRNHSTTLKRAKRLCERHKAVWVGPDSIRMEERRVILPSMSGQPDMRPLFACFGTEGPALPVTPEWLLRMGYSVFGHRLVR